HLLPGPRRFRDGQSHANRSEPRDLQLKASLLFAALPSEREPGARGRATSRNARDDPGDFPQAASRIPHRAARDHGESSPCARWHAVIFSQRRKRNSLLTYPSKRRYASVVPLTDQSVGGAFRRLVPTASES